MISLFTKRFDSLKRRDFVRLVSSASMMLPFINLSASPSEKSTVKRPLCIFSKHLQFLNYEDMAKTAAGAGFDGVDLAVRPGGHVLPENAQTDLPRAVEAVKKAGLEVYMMTTAITNPDDPNTIPILRTASELDVRFYRLGYLRYDEKIDVMAGIAAHKPSIKGLELLNKKYNLHGAYQNHAGTRIGGPVWDVYELIKECDPKWMGVQYDVRHAMVEGATSWPVGMRLLKNFIKITALKDFYWTKESGKWQIINCPIGQGMVDFKKYFELVKEYNVVGPVSVHFEYPMPGEEHQETNLNNRITKTIEVMRRDVETVREKMTAVGI
jgi:L-ribulose-5-phosphate 3-epimerase